MGLFHRTPTARVGAFLLAQNIAGNFDSSPAVFKDPCIFCGWGAAKMELVCGGRVSSVGAPAISPLACDVYDKY